MLCDFQPLDDHRRRCRRCGLTVKVRTQRGRAVWAECQAIDLGQPAAWRPCAHLGPEVGREPCGGCAGRVELKLYRCLHPRHETTTLADCRRCGDYTPLAAPGASARSMLLHFPHGFGDVVQLTTILLHLRQLYPQWAVDVAVRPGTVTMLRGLCRRAYALGEEPPDAPGGAYDARRTLWFHEADASYADSPATKAEKALCPAAARMLLFRGSRPFRGRANSDKSEPYVGHVGNVPHVRWANRLTPGHLSSSSFSAWADSPRRRYARGLVD